jgi:outer membrane protein OmpA-like peptidoglycan-associated protein/tetratricopeptide (TPR) repeat protein
MKKLFQLFLIFLIPLSVFSQAKTAWLYLADEYYKKADYASALVNYLKVLDDSVGLSTSVLPYESAMSNQKLNEKKTIQKNNRKVALRDYVNHQIAMCYLYTADYNHAVNHFKLTSENNSYPEDIYYYGVSLMHVKRHEEAIAAFEKYIALPDNDKELVAKAQTAMLGCYYAMDENNLRKAVRVELADTNTFNKGTTSFGTMFWGSEEKLIFASARKGGVIFDPAKQESEYLLDLYWTEMSEDSVWSRAWNFGRPVNTSLHEATACFNNKNTMFFTRWSDQKRNEQNIYIARMLNMKFFEAYKLDTNVNCDGCKSINPFVSLDGRTLYFSSNRKGGYGGMDLWKIDLDSNGNTVGKAVNLGPQINTPNDEVAPFFHETTGTLFFSSNGHNSIGGFDIFKNTYNRNDSTFGLTINMGMPINSGKDDNYIIWDKYLRHGYLSSDREDCPSGHCYKIYEVFNEPIKIFLSGTVYDATSDDEDPVPGALLSFKDVKFVMDPFQIEADENGYYETELSQNIELFIKARKTGYFADAASINTSSITQTTYLQQDFFLKKIPKDEIEIPGIEYDFDSDKLRPVSFEVLDKIYELLMLNDNLIVEINSHTDCRGSDKYNMDLSQRRAQSCVNYLVSKGVPKERLKAKGFGESQPAYWLDDNKNPRLDESGNRIQLTEKVINSFSSKDEQEKLHQKNRRTAFKVTGEGFNLQSN